MTFRPGARLAGRPLHFIFLLDASGSMSVDGKIDALNQALKFLNARDEDLTKTIQNYGPYASILINIIGTGPWFDAYLANLTGIVSGEFVPGRRPGIVQ